MGVRKSKLNPFAKQLMPLKRCTKDGKSGWKYGDEGACYTGPDAKKKAIKQGLAINKGHWSEADELEAADADILAEAMREFGFNIVETALAIEQIK